MADSVPAALRERATTRAVASWLLLVAVLYWLLGVSALQVATSLATGLVVGAADLLVEVYDLREEVEGLAVGLVSMVGGTALTLLEGGSPSAGIPILAVGGWVFIDALQFLRHEGVRDPSRERDGHDVYREYVTRRVHQAVADEPRTTRELREALDADAEAVDRAVETLLDRGAVELAGSELRTTRTERADRGRGASARVTVVGWLRRLLRPITVEFDSESSGRRVP